VIACCLLSCAGVGCVGVGSGGRSDGGCSDCNADGAAGIAQGDFEQSRLVHVKVYLSRVDCAQKSSPRGTWGVWESSRPALG
jgi:hypothetical protein